jgi:hypothetical protein
MAQGGYSRKPLSIPLSVGGCLVDKEIILLWGELFKITSPLSDFDLKMIVRSLVNTSLIQNFTLLQGILKWEVSLYG